MADQNSTRLRFQVTIHVIPGDASSRERPTQLARVSVGAHQVAPLAIQAPHVDQPMPLSFEEAEAEMNAWERMFIEPDGSFVWRQEPYQLDGGLFDDGTKLSYVELAGTCNEAMLDRVLSLLGSPKVPLMFQLTQKAIFIDEEDFRRLVLS